MTEQRLAWGGMARRVPGLGPGLRTVVWVTGCSRRCPGCMTPELLDAQRADMPVEEAAALVLEDADWDGRLTVSGGDPFEQAPAVAALLRTLRAHRDCEVLVYTGYRLEELRSSGPEGSAALLREADMIIDGPFLWGTSNRLQWRGSDNQRFVALTPKGARHLAEAEGVHSTPRPLSFQLVDGVGVRVVGIPERRFFSEILDRLEQKGVNARLSPGGRPRRRRDDG